MERTRITLDGFDAFQRVMRAAPEVVRAHASQAVASSTFAVAQRARTLAAFDTGALRSAISSAAIGLNGRVGVGGGSINGREPGVYWRFVEFGTIYKSARPFFRPAAEAEANGFIERMRAIGPRVERDLSSSRFR